MRLHTASALLKVIGLLDWPKVPENEVNVEPKKRIRPSGVVSEGTAGSASLMGTRPQVKVTKFWCADAGTWEVIGADWRRGSCSGYQEVTEKGRSCCYPDGFYPFWQHAADDRQEKGLPVSLRLHYAQCVVPFTSATTNVHVFLCFVGLGRMPVNVVSIYWPSDKRGGRLCADVAVTKNVEKSSMVLFIE